MAMFGAEIIIVTLRISIFPIGPSINISRGEYVHPFHGTNIKD